MDGRGIYSGTQLNGKPIFIDLRQQVERHGFILGRSGPGRAYRLKEIVNCEPVSSSDQKGQMPN
ncbi:hypothetical protein ABES02_29420 [Neobacillus pocheonensis]|uniref:hypothetical protein n=1 Tax=Neobacillus pocheonensis TaxID=363869 RepID=UPI003D2DF163